MFIHAQAVNDLLRGEIARFWPFGFGMLAFATMATAGSVFSIFLRAQTAGLLLAGTLLLWVAGTVASASLDWFAPLLGGVTAAVAAFLIGLGLRTFVIDRERRRMALALSRYLDVHLAQKLMESDRPPELGGETREVTIWFSDIAGFSTVAETMDAKELVAQLNAHFTLIGQAIEAEGGIIDKYVGDAVVAIFGALVPLPNQPPPPCAPRSRCRSGSPPRRARRARSRSASASTPAAAWWAMWARSTASTTRRSAIP